MYPVYYEALVYFTVNKLNISNIWNVQFSNGCIAVFSLLEANSNTSISTWLPY